MQAGEALSSGAAWLGLRLDSPGPPMLWPCRVFTVCSWNYSQESWLPLILGRPSLQGSGGDSPPSWLPPLSASLPCPLSGLVAAVCYPSE